MPPRPNRDEYFLSLLPLIAARSTCARRKAAAIAVDEIGRVLGVGYNGQPRGWEPHCNEKECSGARDPAGDTHRCEACHAEINLILNTRDLDSIHTIYLSASPCSACALALCNLSNVRKVIYLEKYADGQGIDYLCRSNILVEERRR